MRSTPPMRRCFSVAWRRNVLCRFLASKVHGSYKYVKFAWNGLAARNRRPLSSSRMPLPAPPPPAKLGAQDTQTPVGAERRFLQGDRQPAEMHDLGDDRSPSLGLAAGIRADGMSKTAAWSVLLLSADGRRWTNADFITSVRLFALRVQYIRWYFGREDGCSRGRRHPD